MGAGQGCRVRINRNRSPRRVKTVRQSHGAFPVDDRIEDAGREVPAHLVRMVPVGLMQFEARPSDRSDSPRFADGRDFADAVVSLDAFQSGHARSRQRVLGTRSVLPLEELVDQRNRPGLLRDFSELHRVVKVVLVVEAWLLALVLADLLLP